MSTPTQFLDALSAFGVRFVSGVPCSYFTGPLQLIDAHSDLHYVAAANEGGALAAAAGARLAGTPSAVLVQNSGFGNLINPLTSLLIPYRIPVLAVMSMRGWPTADSGEPQHRVMGKVVQDWLSTMDVPFWEFTADGPPLPQLLDEAATALADGSPAFVLVGKGAIGADDPVRPCLPQRSAPAVITGATLAATVWELADPHDPVLATTGYLSRALFHAGDRSSHFYMQGSMGHVASVALGVALHRPDRRVIVLDGDGAALMHLGAFASVGGTRPPNLVHVVFDNGSYESTGAQPVPAAVDFAAIAAACGYRTILTVSGPRDLADGVRKALSAPGPVLLAVTGTCGTAASGRASEAVPVETIAKRFATSLASVVTYRASPEPSTNDEGIDR